MVVACGIWYFVFQVVGMVWSCCSQAPLFPSSGAREYYTDGCCLWYLVLCFSSCQYGVELLQSGTIMPIIRSSRLLYRWLLPVVFGALVFKLSVWYGAAAAARKPDTQPSAFIYSYI
jgi:hypothetical protein